MKNYQERFFQIAQELKVTSFQNYHHLSTGEKLVKGRGEELGELSQENQKVRIVRELSYFIYFHYHLRSSSEVQRLWQDRTDDLTPIIMREHPEFGHRLREANRGVGYTDEGWTILHVRNDTIEVVKGGIHLSARPDELWSSDRSFLPTTKVSLRFPNDRPYANPGYYTVVGNAGPPDNRSDKLVRTYFNICPPGAPDFLATLTKALNKLRLKFLLKILNHPDAYPRSDAAVLYLRRESFTDLQPLLIEMYTASAFGNATSFFTKSLAPGIAVAEETTDEVTRQMSFGQHRSLLVAQGIARNFFSGQDSVENRYQGILNEFQTAGLDTSQPYLDTGSRDIYRAFCPEIEEKP